MICHCQVFFVLNPWPPSCSIAGVSFLFWNACFYFVRAQLLPLTSPPQEKRVRRVSHFFESPLSTFFFFQLAMLCIGYAGPPCTLPRENPASSPSPAGDTVSPADPRPLQLVFISPSPPELSRKLRIAFSLPPFFSSMLVFLHSISGHEFSNACRSVRSGQRAIPFVP